MQTFEQPVAEGPMAPPCGVSAPRRWPLALASALHSVALASLIFGLEVDGVGAGGTDRDATKIEITLVTASALDTHQNNAAAAPAAAGTAAPTNQGGEVEIPVAAIPVPDPLPRSELPPELQSPPDELPRVEPRPIDQALTPEPQQQFAEAIRMPAEPTPSEALAAAPPPQASSAGGVESVGSALTAQPTPAAAAAPPGRVDQYARTVAETLSRQRPRGLKSGQRGTVVVRFTVSPDGAVADANVSSSSGSTALDKVVLTAVTATRFLSPPEGMSVAQLTYVVPFHIR